jgi:uncharacterized protein (DUF169 family)
MDYKQAATFIRDDLRLKTLPMAVKFLQSKDQFPEKTRRPSTALGKKITICQAVTMARVYGWTVGVTKDDLICVPAMVTFGLTPAVNQPKVLGKLFCEVGFLKDEAAAQAETGSMQYLAKGEYEGILLAPLERATFEPDTVVLYGNPAQVMRLIQGWVYNQGQRLGGNFGGKVECAEYLIAPFKSQTPRIAIPGNGDRIFSMTQDDEMVFGLPASGLEPLIEGLKEAGKKIGARYPITFYQNYQPEFPKPYKVAGEELGVS